MSRKLPVIFAGTNCLSGVTSWSDRLCATLANHPRYAAETLYVGHETNHGCHRAVKNFDEAFTLLRQLAPAIVVPNYVWQLFLAGFEPNIRCLGICHADDFDQYYLPLRWYEPLVSKYIAVSRECTAKLADHVPWRTDDIITLPYGICIPDKLERTYQTRPLRLIYAGRVTQPQKRVWDFVPLVENLLRMKVPFVFDIIGGGDEFAPLAQMMRARVPAAEVNFIPRIPHSEMAAKWLGHDIFLQVSDFEGTSVSMLEAMAHGAVPVVTAASSGISGVINSGDNGFVVPVGDMSAMADVIAQLAADETLLADTGRTAYRAVQAYSMDLYARKFTRILDEIADADHIEVHDRYGIFAPLHPLVVQHKMLQQHQRAIEALKPQSGTGALLKGGILPWRRGNKQPPSNENRAA